MMTDDERNLMKEAAKGLEAALHLLTPSQSITLEYMTPAGRLRQQADAMDYRDQKLRELCDLSNRLREALKNDRSPR